MLRDASLRDAPQHQAEKSSRHALPNVRQQIAPTGLASAEFQADCNGSAPDCGGNRQFARIKHGGKP